MLILFFVNVFTFPFILYFSEYVSANFGYIYSPKSHQLYLPLPPSETSFVSISSLPEKNKKYSNKNFQFFERNNQSFPGKKAEFKRFTIFPFFNNNLQSLKVHMARVTLSSDVDPRVIARGTPGFSGADLMNLVNEAALMAARKGKTSVTMLDLELAKDKVMMGAERKSMVMTENEKRLTAYHEAGHAKIGRAHV